MDERKQGICLAIKTVSDIHQNKIHWRPSYERAKEKERIQ